MPPTSTPRKPRIISVRENLRNPLTRSLYRLVEQPFEKFLQVDRLNRYYAEYLEAPQEEEHNFWETALEILKIDYVVADEDLARVPQAGPLLVVANHPYGGIDGIIMGAMLSRLRDDFRVLGNYLLNNIPEIRPWVIAVDPFGGKNATRSNIGPMKQCLQYLRQGGALATFPSGTVSHLFLRKGRVTDPRWSDNTGALVRRTQATVLPVYFEGRNSTFFQIAGLFHPRLRTALLPKELLRLQRSQIRVRVGKPLSWARLSHFDNDRDLTEYLRLNTYVLQNRDLRKTRRSVIVFPKMAAPRPVHKPIREPLDPAVLAREIEALPQEHLMVEHGPMRVYVTRAHLISQTLLEIGRLREKTFREVGEGTGEAIDLDKYDDYYLHIFMWNRETREIVGGYRMGPTDEILPQRGENGLYTTTLFRFKPGFIRELDPAMELGRSFIISKYQRKHTSLSLIWRGIGEWLARNPQYRYLFGPVSISHDYQPLSKNLIVQFLRKQPLDPALKGKVKAKTPPRPGTLGPLEKKSLYSTVRDIEDVSALISEIETDRKGVPVLLRQYLRLNARILSFNVDREFMHVIDGFVLADIPTVDPKVMKRFMGDDGAKTYMDYHARHPRAAALPR